MSFLNSRKHKKVSLSPTQYVFISFVLIILTGAVLLYLPISQTNPNGQTTFIDALFTATSATCVTGLVVYTTAAHWTLFGQIVILCLIQLGGLTIITIYSFIIIHLGKKVTLKNRLIIQSAMNQSSLKGLAKFVLMVIKGTLLVEGIAAILLSISFFGSGTKLSTAIYYGIFHAVSAFCNAGFDVIGDSSLQNYAGSPMVNIVIMSLIVIGGIGFTVWRETLQATKKYISDKKKNITHKKHRFSTHTKLAVISTIILIFSGAIYFFVFEFNNPKTLENLSTGKKIMASFFQSITLRTAGFYTIDQNGLHGASKFISSIFMIIGGSPGGTSGGIKTVTVALFFCCAVSVIKGHEEIVFMRRRIPTKTFFRAVAIAIIMVFLMFIATAILGYTESGSAFKHTFLDLLFESSSALGTVGLTTGITAHLTNIGKMLITLCMFIGRLGPITIAIALHRKPYKIDNNILHPEEDILIG